MTGHDVRTILSATPDMMTSQTGSPDIMSMPADLRKQRCHRGLDIMSRPTVVYTTRGRDLRKRGSCPGSVTTRDIMSDPTTIVTIRSGRSSR